MSRLIWIYTVCKFTIFISGSFSVKELNLYFICFPIANFRVALLQLAVKDRAYLLDISALLQIFTSEDWEDFAQQIFCNENILKLGENMISKYSRALL